MNRKFFIEYPYKPHLDKRYGDPSLNLSQILDSLLNLYEKMMNMLDEVFKEDIPKPILMHGTLIGWKFGKKPLPWDNDIDVCFLREAALQLVNLRKHEDEDILFRVNPNWNTRRGDVHNIIDARVICKHTGVFIDITFLLPIGKKAVSCKSPHRYLFEDLLPLTETTFSGFKAYVPSNVDKVLVSEYGKRVLLPRYKGRIFDGENWGFSFLKKEKEEEEKKKEEVVKKAEGVKKEGEREKKKEERMKVRIRERRKEVGNIKNSERHALLMRVYSS